MLTFVARVLGSTLCVLGLVSITASGILTAKEPFTDFPAFGTTAQKLVAEYSYFTLWSAIIGTAVAGAYALGHGRSSATWARVLRLDAAMMLIVTGLVYNLIIADGTPKHGWWAFTNTINHELLPVAMPLVWILTMPLRGSRDITWPVIGRALIIPTIWVGYCLIRGAMTGFYPYDFLNVVNLGYATAIRNIIGVYALFFVLVGLLSVVERALTSEVVRHWRVDPSSPRRLHAYRPAA